MGKSNNSAILSVDKEALARKRREKSKQVDELVFDEDKRREYLTGFRKRKQKRLNDRREKAKARDSEAKKQETKEVRMSLVFYAFSHKVGSSALTESRKHRITTNCTNRNGRRRRKRRQERSQRRSIKRITRMTKLLPKFPS